MTDREYELKQAIIRLEATFLELKIQRDNALHFCKMKESECENLRAEVERLKKLLSGYLEQIEPESGSD